MSKNYVKHWLDEVLRWVPIVLTKFCLWQKTVIDHSYAGVTKQASAKQILHIATCKQKSSDKSCASIYSDQKLLRLLVY